MSSQKHPKFVWFIGLAIVGVIGWYAASRQDVESIAVPGGRITFREPHVTDDSVSISISYDGGTRVTSEGRAMVFLNGQLAATLTVAADRPFDTKSVTVPGPGEYAYRIEQHETMMLNRDGASEPEPVPIDMVGSGKIDIRRGAAFQVVAVLNAGFRPARFESTLSPVLSDHEKQQRHKESQQELEKLFSDLEK